MQTVKIKELTTDDLGIILEIQRSAYIPELNEGEAAFFYKLKISPNTCIGAYIDKQICGYLFAQPYKFGEIIPLDKSTHQIPEDPDCMYIHDLAISQDSKKKRIGTMLYQAIEKQSIKAGFRAITLVSVQDSGKFWEQQGFHAERRFEYIPGVPAVYMIKMIIQQKRDQP
jgi:ribosomal protein S18 acetylase RimI-like enzyme